MPEKWKVHKCSVYHSKCPSLRVSEQIKTILANSPCQLSNTGFSFFKHITVKWTFSTNNYCLIILLDFNPGK